MIKAVAIFVLVFSTAWSIDAQSSKRRPAKVKPIHVTVNVKGNVPPAKPLPNESDYGIWNTFELKGDDIQILMPATNENVEDNPVGPVRSYEATTSSATYTLIVREIGSPLMSGQTDALLDSMVGIAYGSAGSTSRVIAKKNISYLGGPGREIIAEERGKRIISRIYILNGKLIGLSIVVDLKAYKPEFGKWISKFFDSLNVRLPLVNES